MGRACRIHELGENMCKVLVEEREEGKALGGSRHRWEDDIK
jgi:hypothetical protein